MSQMKNKYDVIIVGAGPSGCSCAFELKKYNKNVLLLDKHTFPRHKPCAGGITIKALNHLPININHLIKHTAKKMIFSFKQKKEVKLSHKTGSCVMVIRDEFDNYFFNETLKKGVDFKNSKEISSINYHNSTISVNIDGDIYQTSYLVGADGANSIVRKLTSNLKFNNPVFAYEGIVKKNDNDDIPTEFIFTKTGYAWVFPKDNHYNVGLGNLIINKKIKKLTKQDLFDFVKSKFNSREIKSITAFPIGTEGINYQAMNNILLVGDAAGLAESLLGEGIYNAILSGKYAAKSIVDGKTQPSKVMDNYNKFLYHLSNELKLYKKGSKILYNFPRFSYYMLKLGLGKKFMNGYSEGKTLSEIMGKSNMFTN
tara:strand:- start:342 stop:1448 length:1107 start_codon:yes stop_codon:yes gene_type:complete